MTDYGTRMRSRSDIDEAADGGRQVPHGDEMPHLLDGDIKNGAPPALHGRNLFGIEPLVCLVLQAEGGAEVGAHQVVFEFGRLMKRMNKLIASIYGECCVITVSRFQGYGRRLPREAA